jgi:RNA polymerase sigma-70 factor (ECF subfamily)
MTSNGIENYKAFLKGDEKALEGLVATYSDNIIYYAYHTVANFSLAEDIMESAFLKLIIKQPSLKDEGELAVYLFKALAEGIREWNKKRQKITLSKNLFGEIKDIPENEWASANLIKTPEDKIKFDVLSHYESKAKPILFLYFFQKFNRKQISEITGTDEDFVGKVMALGRERLINTVSVLMDSELPKDFTSIKKGDGKI